MKIYVFKFLFATTVRKFLHTLNTCPRVALLYSKAVMQDMHTPFKGDSSLILKWEASKRIPVLDDHPLSVYKCNDGVPAGDGATCPGFLALLGFFHCK